MTRDFADYHALHGRLNVEHPRTGTCQLCGKSPGRGRSGTHWAKRSGMPYAHDISHFIEACAECNRRLSDADPAVPKDRRARISESLRRAYREGRRPG